MLKNSKNIREVSQVQDGQSAREQLIMQDTVKNFLKFDANAKIAEEIWNKNSMGYCLKSIAYELHRTQVDKEHLGQMMPGKITSESLKEIESKKNRMIICLNLLFSTKPKNDRDFYHDLIAKTIDRENKEQFDIVSKLCDEYLEGNSFCSTSAVEGIGNQYEVLTLLWALFGKNAVSFLPFYWQLNFTI